MKIVECIPNFSEGRDEGKVEQIVEEVRKVAGVKLLDYFSDPDHNRTVVTFLGEPSAVKEAALKASLKALELIDMRSTLEAIPAWVPWMWFLSCPFREWI